MAHAVSKLDDLITTTIDSIKGYEQAADHADAAAWGETLRTMAQDRRAVVAMLQAESRRLGGTPNDFGSVAGDFHRRWEEETSASCADEADAEFACAVCYGDL